MMSRRLEGSVTVYFSFVTLLLIALIGALLEGSRVNALQVRLPQAVSAAGESLLASYDRDLLAEYGLLFYREDVPGTAELLFNVYLAPELDVNIGRLEKYPQLLGFVNYRGLVIDGYRATDNKGSFFLHEVIELMKYQETTALLNKLYSMIKADKDSKSMIQLADDERASFNDTDWQKMANQIKADASGVELDSETFEPAFGGTLNQAAKEEVDESIIGRMERIVGNAELSVILPDKKISAMSEKVLPIWLHNDMISGLSEPDMDFVQEILFIEYVQSHFGSFLAPSGAGSLQYEQEYIINGFSSDALNCALTINRLMAFRAGLNIASILAHAELYSQVSATASLLVGWTGLPALVEAVKVMMIATWGMGEAILDVRTLAEGEKVAFYKNAKTMTTSLTDCVSKVASGKRAPSEGSGIDYDMYLKLFLFLEGNAVIERTMKMIEMDMRLKDPLFSFDRLMYGFELGATAMSRPVFSPAYRNIADEKMMDYSYEATFTY